MILFLNFLPVENTAYKRVNEKEINIVKGFFPLFATGSKGGLFLREI
jgi:hypothetical protein